MRNLGKIYGIFHQILTTIEGIFLAIATIALAILNVANVGMRLLGDSGVLESGGIAQAEELNIILVINITFAGTSYAARSARHIRMTAIVDMLPMRALRYLHVVIFSTTALLFLALFYFSLQYIAFSAASKQIYTSLGLPRYYFFLWIPVAMMSTSIEYFVTAWKNFCTRDVYIASQIKDATYDDAQGIVV